jgi:glycosyltransferase involved in cell wall biosynthesis
VAEALDQVTPLILTYNEEANIGRTLECLRWAQRIVVVDSYSTDRTLDILAAHPQVEVFSRPFDTHATQWNYGLDQVSTEWALCLDADYQVTASFYNELCKLFDLGLEGIDGLIAPFSYLVYGRPLRQCVYPAKVVMFRPSRSRYCDDGHTQVIQVPGPTITLPAPILHDDRKPLSRWLWAQERYASLEVKRLLSIPKQKLRLVDRLRRMHVVAPFGMLLVCLVRHQGLLDGWRGWFYAFQRMYAELLVSLMLWEERHGQ